MDGFLNVLKPSGPTSHDIVDYIRRLTSVRKVGHTGTLDPGAAGVLVICLGKATRVIRYLLNDKAYRAEITFGVTTTTGDSEGEIISCGDASGLTINELSKALQFFQGEIEQLPPMVSAVKYQGRRLYTLARQGLVVERKPRKVIIYNLQLIDAYSLGSKTPFACLELSCSAGTYVRTFCTDLGERLGCGAYLSSLLRTRTGSFVLENSSLPERIADFHRRGCLQEVLVNINEALAHLPAVAVKSTAVTSVKSGNRLYSSGFAGSGEHFEPGQLVKLLSGGNLLAVARKQEDMAGRYYFQPETVLF